MLGSSYSFAGYVPGDSWMHGVAPGTKALMFVCVLVCALISRGLAGLSVLSALGIAAVALGSPRRSHVFGLVKLLVVLLIAALLLNGFFTPGRGLEGPLEPPFWPTYEGLARGAEACLRLLCLACVAFSLVTTTCPRDIGETAERTLGRFAPFRGAGLALDVAGRFTPDLLRDARRVKAIRSVRGNPYGKGIAGRIKEAGASVLPLMISAVRRAERLSDAMAARCYGASARRPGRGLSKAGRRDWMTICFTGVACGAALFLRGG